MANTTNIPPQAYTRDTLVKAIEWISHQPVAVRERANSADLIVSFYLQARRRMTAAQLEAPVSGETFKQDLKHLAQGLKQFEEPSAPPTQTDPNRSLSNDEARHRAESTFGEARHRAQVMTNFDHPDPVQMPLQGPQPVSTHNHLHTAPSPQNHAQQHVHLHVQHAPLPHAPAAHATPPPPHQEAAHTPKGVTWNVDAKSVAFAREIQERFNLSNESEALRMLVTLGIERARELFP